MPYQSYKYNLLRISVLSINEILLIMKPLKQKLFHSLAGSVEDSSFL